MELIDNKKFMSLFKIGPRTAYKWRQKKLVPYLKIGDKIYYRFPDLLQLLDDLTEKAHSDGFNRREREEKTQGTQRLTRTELTTENTKKDTENTEVLPTSLGPPSA